MTFVIRLRSLVYSPCSSHVTLAQVQAEEEVIDSTPAEQYFTMKTRSGLDNCCDSLEVA